MKKLLLFICLMSLSIIAVAQTGVGWGQQRSKVNFKDSTNFVKLPLFNMTDTLGSQSYTRDAINDSLTTRMAAALPGAAARDSTGTIDALGINKWVTRTYLESYVGSGGGGAFTGDIVRFIVGVTTGAPTTADSTFTHSLFPGKDVDLFRNGALNWNNGNIAANIIRDSYRLNSNTITAKPLWHIDEQIEFRVREPGMWSYVAIEGEELTLLDSLKSYWKMDDASGDLVDFLGYRNLWLPPGVSPTPRQPGKIGYSWLYNPVTDDYHTRYDTTSFNFKDAFSVSAWIKSSAANSDGSIVGKADGGPPVNGWTLEVHAGNATAEMWKNGVEKAVTSATDVSDTNWHQLVMTWDGTLTLYVDGAPEGSIVAPYGFGTYSLFKVTRTLAAWFDGYIDNIGFWHKELSAAEVTELFDKEDVGNEYPWP